MHQTVEKIALLSFLVCANFAQPLLADSPKSHEEATRKLTLLINFDKYDETEQFWKNRLQVEWLDTWEKRIQESRRYKKSSAKQKLLSFARDCDKRVQVLKEDVTLIILEDYNLPRFAYSENGILGPWHKLPRDSIPSVGFWISWLEWYHEDYIRFQTLQTYWEDHAREVYSQAQNQVREELKLLAEGWVKNQTDGLHRSVGYVSSTGYVNVYFSKDDTYQHSDWDVLTDEKLGYQYPPAVAWKPLAKREDPTRYMLIHE